MKKRARRVCHAHHGLNLCRAAPSVTNHNFDLRNQNYLNIEIFRWKRLETGAAERAQSLSLKESAPE